MFRYQKNVELNKNIQKYLSKKELNYSKFILPSKEGEVSIIGKYALNYYDAYKKNFGETFCILDNQLKIVESPDYEKFYYGVSPLLNNSLIIEELSKLSLKDEEGLEHFVKSNASLFMLHKEQAQYMIAMAKYFTLCICSNFGFKLEIQDANILQEFKNFLENKTKQEKTKYNNCLKIENHSVTIHGCPTEQMLVLLRQYRYEATTGNVYLVQKDSGKSFDEICSSKEGITLVNGDVFYSGVLLRPVHIEEKSVWTSNKNISTVCIYYERSTYGTVYTLDQVLVEHPLLSEEEIKLIKKFLSSDDQCKKEWLGKEVEDGEAGRRDVIAQVNGYLKKSYNVNQIGVTGNIITSDDVLIYGKRPKTAIDGGFLYPSVNGNAEIADEDVEFYCDSAEVDFPSMHVDALPFRFGKELCREAEAELNIAVNNNLWKCYGFTISGIMPEENKEDKKRRMHFNIVFKQKINYSFDEILEMQKTAVENYENGELHGVKIKTYENRVDYIAKGFDSLVKAVMNSRDIIGSVLTLALFFLSIQNLDYSVNTLNTMISAFFAGLVILTTGTDVFKRVWRWYKRTKYLHKVKIIKNVKNVEVQLDEAMEKMFLELTCHPVTYVAVRLYLLELSQ